MKQNTRKYYFMNVAKAPNEDVPRALKMCLGGGRVAVRESVNKEVVFIMTDIREINKLLSEWLGQYTLEQILYLTFTEEATKEDARIRLNSDEFTINEEL